MSINNKRQTIAIDIDDVLAQSAKKIIEYSNKKWGMSLAVEDYNEDLSKLWQVDHIEMKRRVDEYFDSGVLSVYEHDPSAMLVLDRLKNKYNLIVITSRNNRTKNDTIDWINNKYPGIFEGDHIHFAGFWDNISDGSAIYYTKGDLVKNLNADYLIDDQLKHCLSVSALGMKSILFGNYSWNKSDNLPQNVQRVENWLDILRYFDESA